MPSDYCLEGGPGARIATFVRCKIFRGACAENRLRSTRARIPLRQRLRGQGRDRPRLRRGGHRRSFRRHGVRGARLLVRGPAGALAPPGGLPRPGRSRRRHPPGRLHPQAAVRQLRHLECPPVPDLVAGRGPPDLVLARGGPDDRPGAAPGAAQPRRRPPGGARPGRRPVPRRGGPQPPGGRLRLRRRRRRAGWRDADPAVRLRQPPPRRRGRARVRAGRRALGGERRRRALAGLFLQDYARERPPYIDLGAAKGIWVNSWTSTLGGNFVAQFTARNYGDYRAHLSELRLAVRGPAGENLDRFLGGDGDPTPLEPGEERAVFKASDGFGTVAGSYAIAAGYLSEQGRWLGIPPGEPGAVDEVGVTVIPPPRRSRVTVTFAGVTVEDADAVGGRLALRLSVGDQAVRWPEEGATDVQDGKRFELDQRFDLVLNPSSVLSVAVTGEDGDGSPAGLVREPYLGLDDWDTGDHTYRSRPSLPNPDPATPEDPSPGRPGPDAGDGPWTIEFAIEVTPLDT